MISLSSKYDPIPEAAFIIRLAGNALSERLAARCAESCGQVGQVYAMWDAYDGTDNTIKPPAYQHEAMGLIRLTDHYLSRSEVACALSHIALWVHCIKIDQPIVVLEHDAIMVRKYDYHHVYNSICYLGNREQQIGGWPIMPTPTHGSEGHNYRFMCRAHAYAIDPAIAKNLFAHVLKFGVCGSLDMMIRADIFPIHQMGMFAYDCPADTTITGRAANGRAPYRNDDLER